MANEKFHLMISDWDGNYDESFDTPQEAYIYGLKIAAEIDARYPSNHPSIPRVIYGEEIDFQSLSGKLD